MRCHSNDRSLVPSSADGIGRRSSREYVAYYHRAAREDPTALNRKLPREALEELLDEIGYVLVTKAGELAKRPGPLRDFSDRNPLPERLAALLPYDFRAFCLALNALKQWVSAEQLAADRYLLGGAARKECREATTACILTEESLDPKHVELHHPVRDGRPPIPLSKKGHDVVERQYSVRSRHHSWIGRKTGPGSRMSGSAAPISSGASRDDRHGSADMQPCPDAARYSADGENSLRSKLLALKRKGNRSWIHLRRGCLDLLGKPTRHSTPEVAACSKTFARNAARTTALSYEQLLAWLDENSIGLTDAE
jgi:hypothetical protein